MEESFGRETSTDPLVQAIEKQFSKAFIDAEAEILLWHFDHSSTIKQTELMDYFKEHALYPVCMTILSRIQHVLSNPQEQMNLHLILDNSCKNCEAVRAQFSIAQAPSELLRVSYSWLIEWIFYGIVEFLRRMQSASQTKLLAAGAEIPILRFPVKLERWEAVTALINAFLFYEATIEQLALQDFLPSSSPYSYYDRERLAANLCSLPSLLISAIYSSTTISKMDDFDRFVKACDWIVPSQLHETEFLDAVICRIIHSWHMLQHLGTEITPLKNCAYNEGNQYPHRNTFLVALTKRLAGRGYAKQFAIRILANFLVIKTSKTAANSTANVEPLQDFIGFSHVIPAAWVPEFLVYIISSLVASASEKKLVFAVLYSLAPFFYLSTTKAVRGTLQKATYENGMHDSDVRTDNLNLCVHSDEAFELLRRLVHMQLVNIDWEYSLAFEFFNVKSFHQLPVGLAAAVIDVLSVAFPDTVEAIEGKVDRCPATRMRDTSFFLLDIRKLAVVLDCLIEQWGDMELQESLDQQQHCFLAASLSRCIWRSAMLCTTKSWHCLSGSGSDQVSNVEAETSALLKIDSNRLKTVLNGLHNRFNSPRLEVLLCGMKVAECLGDYSLCQEPVETAEDFNPSISSRDLHDKTPLRFTQLHEDAVPLQLWELLACDKEFLVAPRKRISFRMEKNSLQPFKSRFVSLAAQESISNAELDLSVVIEECSSDTAQITSTIRSLIGIFQSPILAGATVGYVLIKEAGNNEETISDAKKLYMPSTVPTISAENTVATLENIPLNENTGHSLSDTGEVFEMDEDDNYFSQLPDLVAKENRKTQGSKIVASTNSEMLLSQDDSYNYLQPPINIRQCLERLTGPSNRAEISKELIENSDPSRPYEKEEQPMHRTIRISQTLQYLPAVLSAPHDDVEECCIPLCRVLLLLDGEGVKDFERIQLQCITEIIVQKPLRVVDFFCSAFFDVDWALSHRLLMLRSMQFAARKLSDRLLVEEKTDRESLIQNSSEGLDNFPASAEAASHIGKRRSDRFNALTNNSEEFIQESKIRIFASATKLPKASTNLFAPIAGLCFDWLISLFRNPVNYSSDQSMGANARYKAHRKFICQRNCLADPLLVGGLLHTVAVFIECAGIGSLALIHMINCSLELLQTYYETKNAHITRCLISLAGRCSMLVNNGKLLNSVVQKASLDNLLAWLRSCTTSSDSISRNLAEIVLNDLTSSFILK